MNSCCRISSGWKVEKESISTRSWPSRRITGSCLDLWQLLVWENTQYNRGLSRSAGHQSRFPSQRTSWSDWQLEGPGMFGENVRHQCSAANSMFGGIIQNILLQLLLALGLYLLWSKWSTYLAVTTALSAKRLLILLWTNSGDLLTTPRPGSPRLRSWLRLPSRFLLLTLVRWWGWIWFRNSLTTRKAPHRLWEKV